MILRILAWAGLGLLALWTVELIVIIVVGTLWTVSDRLQHPPKGS